MDAFMDFAAFLASSAAPSPVQTTSVPITHASADEDIVDLSDSERQNSAANCYCVIA